MHNTNYFQVALSCSLVVYGFDGKRLLFLTEKRNEEPFKGAPMLPTEMVEPNQDINDVVENILMRIFGIIPENHSEQLKAFANPYRDASGRVVNIAEYTVVSHEAAKAKPKPGYQWNVFEEVPKLVFDHNEILDFSKERLKRRVKRRPIGFHLLPQQFTFKQIYTLYQLALRKELDKRNFRNKLFKSDLLIETTETIAVGKNRKKSKLYSFNQREYEKLTLKGYDFSFY